MNEIEVEGKTNDRLEQGDIYSNIDYIESIDTIGNDILIKKIVFPYIVVLSQDCDLKQASAYYRDTERPGDQDKKLLSVIVAPLYNEDLFLKGEHLADASISYKMQIFTKMKKNKYTTHYSNLIDNNTPRYHYLSFRDKAIMPPSIIDFKHFFCVDISYLNSCRREKFICKIKALYRESITQRYSHFLSRIGLP